MKHIIKIKHFFFLSFLFLYVGISSAQSGFGKAEKINDNWKFILQDIPMAKEENFNDVTWQKVDLPHDWSIRQQFSPTYASCMGYLPGGIGWYRKNLPIPAEKSGEKVYLYFEGIYNRSEVYINGHLLGKRPNGYISFLYDASSYIKYGEDNVIAVRKNKLSVAAGENSTLSTAFSVSKPHLWSIDRPYLYTLKTTLLKNGEEIDSSVTKTGFRSYTFDPNKGFALNGEWMKVKGVCLHHDAGVLGAAVPKDVWRQRFLRLKEIGCNAIRTSHNPQAPDFYDLCDEMGFLVMDEAFDEWEFPKRKWIEGWNVGTPGFDGSYDFFEEWGEQDLADMVRRDRNHISIFAWSIGNEVDYPNDPYSHPVLDGGGDTGFTQPIFGGYKKDAPDARRLGDIAKRLVAVVKKYDKSRPTTAGLAGVAMSNETEYPFVLDITGYNYTESMYDSDHKKYPDRVIFGSENRHDMSAWKAVRDKEFIFGQFLWTGIDYLGESGPWPSRGFYSGLIDFGGFIKPRGYFRQSLWSDKPMAYLGTYPTPGKGGKSQMSDVWSQLEAKKAGDYEEKTPSMDAWPIWNYREGQMIRVVCYTNAARAKLLLNEREVGALQDYNDETGIMYWDIPYEPGELKVIGLDADNNEISTCTIRTSKRSYALKIIPEEQRVDREEGVARIALQVVDEDGVPVMISDDEVTCRILGNARLLGLEASNNSDMSDYTDHKHRVYHGRMVAYIKYEGSDPGEIKVRFSAPWLIPTETTVDFSRSRP